MNRISQDELVTWLDSLAREGKLIAPRDRTGVVLYGPVERSAEIAWGSPRPAMSIKGFFFPPTERLFTIEKAAQAIHLTETLPEGELVIFGVRPCDARGLQILDALFIQKEPPDPYFTKRRESTVLVGLACQELGPTCFCESLGISPDSSTGMDLMLVQKEDGFTVQPVTEKGQRFIVNGDLRIANWEDQEVTVSDLPFAISKQQSLIPNLQSLDWEKIFQDNYWEREADRCLSCRACAYVCPTCRCFAVRDEALLSGAGYERIRCWDSCSGENYRRIAGGHNPRPLKGQRLRNRIFCKLFYYPEQTGLGDAVACTGCGRCIVFCPAGVDITEVIRRLGNREIG